MAQSKALSISISLTQVPVLDLAVLADPADLADPVDLVFRALVFMMTNVSV